MKYQKILNIIFIFSAILFFQSSSLFASVDVDMIMNDGGFDFHDRLEASICLKNHDAAVSEAQIFGLLEIEGAFSCNEPSYTSETCENNNCEIHEFPVLEDYAVICTNDKGGSSEAGSKLSNPWNLKDVNGNVWEWCWDWWSGEYPENTQTDYTGSETGRFRVERGGSWYYHAGSCRSASRIGTPPGNREGDLGFRLVRLVP